MEQIDLFAAILRWLRYVQEKNISVLFSTETNTDPYLKPNGFPSIPKYKITDLDSDNLDGFRRDAAKYQRVRKKFKDRLIAINPGFFMNFLSLRLVLTIVEKFFQNEPGVAAKIQYLEIPGVTEKSSMIETYSDEKDFGRLMLLMSKTGLYVISFKIILSYAHRTMTIKCYEHEGVVTFWEPEFQGDIIMRNNPMKFFKFISNLSYADIITLRKKEKV